MLLLCIRSDLQSLLRQIFNFGCENPQLLFEAKRGLQGKSLGNNEIDNMLKTLHYVAFPLPLLPCNRNNTVHSYCCRRRSCQQYKSGSAAKEIHLSCNKIFPTSVNSSKCYARGLRKWLPQFICSNFIIVGLTTEPLPAQHIPLLSYTSLLSPLELPNGFTEPLFGDEAACAVAVPLSKHRSRLKTHCVQVLSLRKGQATDDDYLTV